MPTRPRSRCTSCRKPHDGRGRCDACRARQRAEGDSRRGTARQRGYGREHETRFRAEVLARDPICVLCGRRPATVADHYPASRRQLLARGLDPNDPQYGRGLCRDCDPRQTATRQPGGWNRR